MNILDTVKKAITRHKLLARGDTVIVGVSGGADSTALLVILEKLRYVLGLNLIAVHVNHGLRKEARGDELFVKKLCSQLNIALINRALPKGFLKKQKGSLEDLAREQRLIIFSQVARQFQANAVALAHQRDDLAETILMRILRGTGLQGLQAILPKRTLKDVTFIRPLLDVPRQDIEQFLKKNSLPFRTDSTNATTAFYRNKIRLHLLPLLKQKYNPAIQNTLVHLADTSAVDYDWIASQAQRMAPRMVRKIAGQWHLSLKKFIRLHLSLQRAILRLTISQLQGSTNRLELVHFYELEDLIAVRPEGAVVHLPQDVRVTKKQKKLIFSRRKS